MSSPMSFDITSPQEIKELKEAKFDSRNHWKRVGSAQKHGTGGFLSIFQGNSPLEIKYLHNPGSFKILNYYVR